MRLRDRGRVAARDPALGICWTLDRGSKATTAWESARRRYAKRDAGLGRLRCDQSSADRRDRQLEVVNLDEVEIPLRRVRSPFDTLRRSRHRVRRNGETDRETLECTRRVQRGLCEWRATTLASRPRRIFRASYRSRCPRFGSGRSMSRAGPMHRAPVGHSYRYVLRYTLRRLERKPPLGDHIPNVDSRHVSLCDR